MAGILETLILSLVCLQLSLVTVYGAGNQTKCFQCEGVPKMEDCAHVVTCGDHEECYTRRSTGSIGNVLYESGCISKNICQQLSSISGKRELDEPKSRNRRVYVNCLQCCKGELCNKHLCTKRPAVTNMIECFKCDDVIRPEDCTYTTLCGLDYKCSTVRRQLDVNNELRYQLGCQRKVACDVIETQNNQTNLCVKCCGDNYCNPKMCGFLDQAKPLLIAYPQNKVAGLGEHVQLQCLVAHIENLPFTIEWKHEKADHTTTMPSVTYSNEKQVLDMTVTREHYGFWKCTVTNKNGSVSKISKITPKVPGISSG